MAKKKRKQQKTAPKKQSKTFPVKKRTPEEVKALRKRLIIAGAAALLLVALTVTGVLLVQDSGYFLRRKTVAQTDHFTVNGAMYSYFYYDSYYRQLSGSAAQIYENNGVTEDTTLSQLKDLSYSGEQSWFDFFEGETALRLQSILQYAEAAEDAGSELREEGKSAIESTIQTLKAEAVAADQSLNRYLRDRYGIGVKEEDVRDFLSIYELANQHTEDVKNHITVSADEIEALRTDPTYLKTDLFYFVLESGYTDSMSASKKKELWKKTEANAKALAGITDPQAFLDQVESILRAQYEEKEEELSDEDLSEMLDELQYMNASYALASQIDEEIHTRKKGDVLEFPDEANGSYGVVLIVTAPHLDETPSYNYYTVTFRGDGAVNKANTAKEAFLALENKTEEAFLSLMADQGGRVSDLYENVFLKNLTDSEKDLYEFLSVEHEELSLELLSADENENSLEGASATLILYLDKGRTAFEQTVTNILLVDKYDAVDKEFAEQYSHITVSENSADCLAERG